jgi:ACS family tartrate transporter-like MFS transporter
VLWLLHNGPHDATWLSPEEQTWLDTELERDRSATGASDNHRLIDAFKMPMVWVLAGIYFLSQVGVYTVNLWMPLLLHSVMPVTAGDAQGTAHAAASAAMYSAIPYVLAAIFTVILGWSSDRTGERRGHVALSLLVGASGFLLAAQAHTLLAMLIAMSLCAIGYWSMMGAFWALPTAALGGRAAAGGVSIIMIAGGLGGYFGGDLPGRIHDMTHSYAAGELVIAGMTVGAMLLCLALPARRRS